MKLKYALTTIMFVTTSVAFAANAKNFYGTTDDEFFNAPDRYANPRSIQQYRSIAPSGVDVAGFCRSAEHLDQCLARSKVFLQAETKPDESSLPLYTPTPSIGWIESNDISCEHSFGGTCVVTEGCGDCAPYAFTWTNSDSESRKEKFRVLAGTRLIVIKGTKNDNDPTHRVEVAIAIPENPEHGGPDKSCHLTKRGKFPQIGSLSCGKIE